MLVRLIRKATDGSPRFRRIYSARLYQLLMRMFPDPGWTFMNYGYVDEELNPAALPLDDEDEANRYPVQLYERVARAADWSGRTCLEIGCGRGGGSRYLMKTRAPRSLIGLDLSLDQVEFCRRRHDLPGLSFVQGDAEDLPFPPASFDLVINVESSHGYASMGRFADEVSRVLRPEGRLLWTDLRATHELPDIRAALARAGLEPTFEAEITGQVLAALDLTSDEKRRLIREGVPFWLRRFSRTFAGVRGAVSYEEMRAGVTTYFLGAYRRKGAPPARATSR
jgi:ubiquinone/menaquinone biosynthesis C-methylase UbiE